MNILVTKNLKKYYQIGEATVKVLDGINLNVERGEFTAIVGKSGSGKSTLLHMLGGLDVPLSGQVAVDGTELSGLKPDELTIFRRRKIGFVFQNYNLIPLLNVYENIVLPIKLDGRTPDQGYIKEIVEILGLKEKIYVMPNQLSGGQQQRVALARALAAKPSIVLADEPTGNLDTKTSQDVLGLIKTTSERFGQTVVISAEAVVPYQEDSLREYFTLVYQSRYSPGNYDDDMEIYRKEPDNERFTTRFVGIEESEFDRMNKSLGGTLDKEDFISGRTAVVNPFMGISADGMVGKELSFYLPDGKNPDREHKVMIVAAVGSEFNPAYFAGGYTPVILVSMQYAENILKNPYVELIEVSYEKPLNETLEKELKGMFEDNDSLFFESKLDRYLEMVPAENKIKTLGRGMAVLLAVLAVMNYCNMIAAGAQSRKKEFAALNSIGMTISQQRKVLMLEGLGYGLWSVGLTLLFGIPLSFLVFDGMNQYGIAYSFPVLDNVLLFLVVLAVCVLVPPAAQHFVQKGSVTERLREIS